MGISPVKALQTFPFNKAKIRKQEYLRYFLFKDPSSRSQVLGGGSAAWVEEPDLFSASEMAALGGNLEHKENGKDRLISKIKYKQNEHKDT